MRTWTETHREGTDMGPVDWEHWAIKDSGHPVETLRAIEAKPGEFLVTNDGGWPRVGWKRVIAFRMYDGWPYWELRPALLVSGTLGAEWHWLDRNIDIQHKPVPRP